MNHKNNQSKTTSVAKPVEPEKVKDREFRSLPKSEQLRSTNNYVEKYSAGKNFLVDSVLEYDLIGEYLSDNNYRN
jgi:hypothetical protein